MTKWSKVVLPRDSSSIVTDELSATSTGQPFAPDVLGLSHGRPSPATPPPLSSALVQNALRDANGDDEMVEGSAAPW
jgi:hypothetical protein